MKHIKAAIVCSLATLMVVCLCGCSQTLQVLQNNSIETLRGWSFQYNEGTSDYSLFFGLLNQNDRAISASVDVDIRIVNEEGEEVYNATKSVTPHDFGNYTSQAAGNEFLAEIRIPEKDIVSGKSTNGTVYLTVYKSGVVRFDEVKCSALYCLPIADVALVAEKLPVEIPIKRYDRTVESIIRIDDVSFVYEKKASPTLKINVAGTKIYGGSTSSSDMIHYKLYDSQNYVIKSGDLYIHSISAGDRFKDNSINVYDITPGETYTIIFSEYSW